METPLDLKQPITANDHVRGSPNARVTLVEYGDFECPFCARAQPVVRQLETGFADDLRFVFRHNPRNFDHPHAHQAAEAAEAAAAEGKFWEMHDLLFAHQNALEEQDLVGYARMLGLNTERFMDALRSGAYKARVHADELSGVQSHVISTPTFFINGRRYGGKPVLEALTAEIDSARATAR